MNLGICATAKVFGSIDPPQGFREVMMNPAITNSSKLGFIGIGNMGSRIARRLIDHGYALTAYDRNLEKASALTMDRAALASSVADLTRKADVVISCLTNDEAVLSVYLGPDGVLANARVGSIVLEMSTVSPDTSRQVNRLGFERGLNVLDIAISGSTPAAEQGTLTLLAGGNFEIFNAVKPLLQLIARQYFYLGPSGSGTTMKLVVNTLLGVGMQTVAEAVAFGQKAGLDRNVLLEVLAKTAVISPALTGKLGRVSQEDYSPQFPLELMNKDFRLILETAAEMKVPMPATAAAFQINSAAFGGENGGDFSIVVELMETLARLRAVGEGPQADLASARPFIKAV
jgi:3-hydroxyisobutyrate dehydrogenase-like beta-hydroxyacid dehydrogenase